jgi:hypothetical protein
MVETNATAEEVISEAVRRVDQSPNEKTLVSLQWLFNELSRSAKHSKAVAEALRVLTEKMFPGGTT